MQKFLTINGFRWSTVATKVKKLFSFYNIWLNVFIVTLPLICCTNKYSMLVAVPFRCPSIICSFWLLRWFDDGGDSDVDVEWMNERQTERVNATKISQLLVENNVVWIVNVVCAKVCSCVGAQRIHNTTNFFLILHLFSWLVHEFCSPDSKHLRKCRIFT